MSVIVITRHEQYEWVEGQNDGLLTEEGIENARKSAGLLKNLFTEHGISKGQIFCSPLMRSKQTAAIFQEKLGWPVTEKPRITDPRMDLDIHFKMVASPICNPCGLSTGEVYALMRQPQGFETYEEVAERFSGFMPSLIHGLPNRGTVVVTHAPTPDYLLLQHFRTGLCWGNDIQSGEFLIIRKSAVRIGSYDYDYALDFREVVTYTDKQGLMFNPQGIQGERRKRGYRD